ncbi:hypothetical protein [Xanthomonas campestris]|uniref:hypothetical protein n=1 Tax=Xanthomonas campestris TaxID=339 RepID=UPI001E2DECE1|nr:hypothetical protein [Xanthomonas campestris]MCC5086806.1 hypothetical protein [Xanthomonas campestris]
MSASPSELNRKWSAATQAAMEEKLGRKLSTLESDKIWNTGSVLQLEQIDMAIYYAKAPSNLEIYLAEIPERPPLPEHHTRRN